MVLTVIGNCSAWSSCRGFEQRGLRVARPPALAGRQDLVLHDGGRRAQVQQVDWTASHIGHLAGQVKQDQWIGMARHRHRQVEVAVGSGGALDTAAKGVDGHQV